MKKILIIIAAGFIFVCGTLSAQKVETLTITNVKASSSEGSSVNAPKAVDNDLKTRWSSSYEDNQWLEIELAKPIALENIEIFWENAYAKEYQIQIAEEPAKWTLVYETKAKNNANKDIIKLASKPKAKFIKINCIKRATKFGNSILEVRLNGMPLSVEVLPGKDAKKLTVTNVKTSSSESIMVNGAKAVDGNLNTRWSSSYKDNQWLEIELAKTLVLENIEIFWETAYAKEYQVLVAEKAGKWITVHEKKTKKNADKDIIKLSSKIKAKYIKINCIKRATEFGNSIFEIRLNGMYLRKK